MGVFYERNVRVTDTTVHDKLMDRKTAARYLWVSPDTLAVGIAPTVSSQTAESRSLCLLPQS